MKSTEVYSALNELQKRVGPNAYVTLSITAKNGATVNVSIYPRGILRSGEPIRAEGSSFEAALTAANNVWNDYHAKFHRDTIRRMALKIVDLTHANGTCERSALRMDFTDDTIKQLGDEACALAGEMAAGAPYSIIDRAKSNHPRSEAMAA